MWEHQDLGESGTVGRERGGRGGQDKGHFRV